MLPLFSETSFTEAISGLFHGEGLAFLMIIVAIIVGGVTGIAKLYMIHRERMAMIERGIHPDYKEEEQSTDEKSQV
jgi:hypothetical protein